jgi:hypothetical protein
MPFLLGTGVAEKMQFVTKANGSKDQAISQYKLSDYQPVRVLFSKKVAKGDGLSTSTIQ